MRSLTLVALLLLFLGGLLNLFPSTLAGVANLGIGIFTVQRVIGFLSVLTSIVLFLRLIRA